MFGKNPLRKQDRGSGNTLLVHSVFGTIQGEGPFSGQPAIFVRLAGCNLACFFCDTEFEKGVRDWTLDELFGAIEVERNLVKTNLIVLTGGEPMRQQITPFARQCRSRGLRLQIETAGTVWPEGFETVCGHGTSLTIVCSPKTGRVHKNIEFYCGDWKYIIAYGGCSPEDGLPTLSTQIEGVRAKIYRAEQGTIWLQPREDYRQQRLMDGTFRTEPDVPRIRANTQLAAEIAMRFGYQLSLQVHKLLGLP